MALNIEGQKCPICNSYLFPEDDVVFCPTCGAPHHRDCFKTIGHCGFEHTHGTDEQYDKIKKSEEPENNPSESVKSEAICPNCKNKLTSDMLVCPYCGRPRNMRVFTLDLLGGLKPNTDVGNGVTAAEAREFVQINSQRYIPVFKILKKEKISWNWAAFLFPEAWFLSRKMYKIGSLFTAISVATQICFIPFIKIINTAVFSTYNEYFNFFLKNIDTFGKAPLVLAFSGAMIMLITRIIAGITGDKIYRKHAINKIIELRKSGEREIQTKKSGGINVFAFLIGIIITTYLPEIISMLF